MDRFACAYRDPKSPLTPLTPLADNHAFNFNISVKPSTTPTSARTPRRPADLNFGPRYPEDYRIAHQNVKRRPTAPKSPAPFHHARADPIKSPVPPQKCRMAFSPCQPAAGGCCGPRNIVISDKQRFCKASPVKARPLDRAVYFCLMEVGQLKYAGIFQREDIDLDVFCLLTDGDLVKLGIQNATDRNLIMRAVRFATRNRSVLKS